MTIPTAAEAIRANSMIPRFLAKTKRAENGCLEWQGAKTSKVPGLDYGQFYAFRKRRLAHRIAWQIFIGPIPDKLCVLHKCDNPPCVDPSHLFLGTLSDNAKDCVRKGRSWMQNVVLVACPKGHPYTEDNTGKSRGWRYCLRCKREDSQRRRDVARLEALDVSS